MVAAAAAATATTTPAATATTLQESHEFQRAARNIIYLDLNWQLRGVECTEDTDGGGKGGAVASIRCGWK